jgi:hypothetical protein
VSDRHLPTVQSCAACTLPDTTSYTDARVFSIILFMIDARGVDMEHHLFLFMLDACGMYIDHCSYFLIMLVARSVH